MLHIVTTRAQFLQYTEPSVNRYFAEFSPADRAARHPHSDTLHAYLGNVVGSSLTSDTETSLALAVADAEARLQRTGRLDEHFQLPHAMLTMSATLPWRVAFLTDAAEGGWPHTHGTVICLPISVLNGLSKRTHHTLVELLVHERTHVLQRLDPEAARRTIRAWYGDSVHPVARRGAVESRLAERLRSNPDIDAYVYGGYPSVMAFPSLRDAVEVGMRSATLQRHRARPAGGQQAQAQGQAQGQAQAHEHPFESMAYDFARAAASS